MTICVCNYWPRECRQIVLLTEAQLAGSIHIGLLTPALVFSDQGLF